MNKLVKSKMVSVMCLGLLSVLFTANTAQAIVFCCCCGGPMCGELVGTDCNDMCGGFRVGSCPSTTCTDYCSSIANEETTDIIESFMPDEYVDEVIAMDEECSEGADETADVGAE